MLKQIPFENIKREGCEHCIHNPKTEKPHIKMKTIDLTDFTLKALTKLERETGLNRNCILCISVRELLETPIEEIFKLVEATKILEAAKHE